MSGVMSYARARLVEPHEVKHKVVRTAQFGTRLYEFIKDVC